MRFVVMMDPAGQWLVYDEVAGMPAERDGAVFVGLSRKAAEDLASEANSTYAGSSYGSRGDGGTGFQPARSLSS